MTKSLRVYKICFILRYTKIGSLEPFFVAYLWTLVCLRLFDWKIRGTSKRIEFDCFGCESKGESFCIKHKTNVRITLFHLFGKISLVCYTIKREQHRFSQLSP